MIYSYFPGCTLKNKAASLDKTARICAQVLGITLQELPEWQCCGGVYPLESDRIATRLSSVRALSDAHNAGHPLVTLCSACHNVLKQVNSDMKNNGYISSRVNNYLAPGFSYHGETEVIHYLELLRDVIGFDVLKSKVKKPFTDRKIGAFYGCLLLRPGRVMQMDDPENPQILEDFIRAVGGEPVIYAQRNECCGGYMTLEHRTSASVRACKVLENAESCGAELLITACPLCLYNLTRDYGSGQLPVRYFTEILAEALGVTEETDAE